MAAKRSHNRQAAGGARPTPAGPAGSRAPRAGPVDDRQRRASASPRLGLFERVAGNYEYLFSILLLVAAGLLVYANSWHVPLVFDGDPEILNNKSVHQVWPLSKPMGGTTRPLVYFTFALNYVCGGRHVEGYHAVNLAIHILAVLTLWGLVARSTQLPRLRQQLGAAGPRLALLAALVWMVHPLQTQSVTYVYQRLESLMGLLFLLTLYTFVRAATSSGRAGLWQLASVCCALIAMGSKEVAAAAPVLVLAYDRVFVAGAWREIFSRRKTYYLALAGTYLPLAWLLVSFSPKFEECGQIFVKNITPLDYALSQPAVVLHYLRLAVCPTGLCLDYAWPVARSAREIALPLTVVVGLLIATGVCLVRRPTAGYLGLWFFVILAPTSSIVPIRDLAFEHRMYLPLAALAVGAVFGGYLLAGRHASAPLIAGALSRVALPALAVAIGFAALSVARNHDYRTALAIWADTVQKRPQNANAQCNYGAELVRSGDRRSGFAALEKTLAINPDHALAHQNLAAIYSDWAAGALRRSWNDSTPSPPGQEPPSDLRNLSYEELTDRALGHYRKSIELKPNRAASHSGLASLLVVRDEVPQALRHFEESLRLDPDLFQAHRNLGMLLCRLGRFDEGVQHLQRALEVEPGDPIARRNLRVALTLRDQSRERR